MKKNSKLNKILSFDFRKSLVLLFSIILALLLIIVLLIRGSIDQNIGYNEVDEQKIVDQYSLLLESLPIVYDAKYQIVRDPENLDRIIVVYNQDDANSLDGARLVLKQYGILPEDVRVSYQTYSFNN